MTRHHFLQASLCALIDMAMMLVAGIWLLWPPSQPVKPEPPPIETGIRPGMTLEEVEDAVGHKVGTCRRPCGEVVEAHWEAVDLWWATATFEEGAVSEVRVYYMPPRPPLDPFDRFMNWLDDWLDPDY